MKTEAATSKLFIIIQHHVFTSPLLFLTKISSSTTFSIPKSEVESKFLTMAQSTSKKKMTFFFLISKALLWYL